MANRPGFKGDPQVAMAAEIAFDPQGEVQVFGAVGVPAADLHQDAAAKGAKGPGNVVDQVPFG
jgi:hypothetical protein